MPKAPASGPLSVIFAINKPTGVVSMQLLNKIQPLLASSTLFKAAEEDGGQQKKGKKKWGKGRRGDDQRVKLGQGGTLDPLADGVLVLGVNGATKQLASFLDCTKEYRSIGLFGCSTDSYDSQGKRVHLTSYAGITAEKIETVLSQFRGEFEQIPPVFSALKMDGKPLYEYARNGVPLPRPIAPRKVHVQELKLLSFTPGSEHSYEFPKESLPESERIELDRLQKMVKEGATVIPELKPEDVVAEPTSEPAQAERPPIFEIRMTVSGGTYVRSIIHDIGIALGSSAHVVKLTRTRQGEFMLNSEAPLGSLSNSEAVKAEALPAPTAAVDGDAQQEAPNESEKPVENVPAKATPVAPPPILETFAGGCVEWEVLEAGLRDLEATKNGGEGPARNEEGMLPWEAEILHRCKQV